MINTIWEAPELKGFLGRGWIQFNWNRLFGRCWMALAQWIDQGSPSFDLWTLILGEPNRSKETVSI